MIQVKQYSNRIFYVCFHALKKLIKIVFVARRRSKCLSLICPFGNAATINDSNTWYILSSLILYAFQ